MGALWEPTATVLLFALAVYGAGSLCCHRLQTDRGSLVHFERLLWGLAAWTLGLFSLACLGGLRPLWLAGLVAVPAVWGLLSVVCSLRRGRFWPGFEPLSLAALAALPLVFVFAITVNPTVSWDGAVYHLALPDLYLRTGGFRHVPLLVYSVWPQAVELLFAAVMSLDGYVAAKALHFGFGVLVAATLFAQGWAANGRGWRFTVGLLAAGLFLLNDVVLFELRAAYTDLAMAFFALAAYLFLERWLDVDPDGAGDRYLIAAGMSCGLLAASKINGIVVATCLSLLMVPRLVSGLRPDRRSDYRLGSQRVLRAALAFSVPFVVVWLPWLARTWVLTGNPVYPLFYDTFGGPDWSSALGDQFLHWQRSIGMGRQPLDWLLLPWRVLTAGGLEYERFGGRLTPLWLVFLPLALWRARQPGRARRCLGLVGLLFLTWALGSQQMRFLIPALPLLALAVADGLTGLAESRLPGRLADSPAPARIAVVLWLAVFAGTQSRLLTAGWSHLKLYASPDFEMPPEAPSPPVFGAIAELPKGATVLLLNTNHLFYCRPTTCWADSFFEASQISDWLGPAEGAEELARLLWQRGVSHVAWSGKARGIVYPPAVLQLLQRPDLARPVLAEGPDRLWQLELRDVGVLSHEP